MIDRKFFDGQDKMRESLAKQIELLSKASDTAYTEQQFEALAHLSEAMGMLANSYLVTYSLNQTV